MPGIYLHIPFCKQACHYCDFHFSTLLKYKADMVEALKTEIMLSANYLNGAPLDTIYFGGGTPSVLHERELDDLLVTIAKTHKLSPRVEITLEANPDDLTDHKLNQLKLSPVNRLSIGIQSFRNEDLEYMHRAHNATQAERCVKAAQDVGFNNITIDLIYGAPTTPNDAWGDNLSRALALEVQHISAYCLTVEPGTALARFVANGKSDAPDEDRASEQFITLIDTLTSNGYQHYEISNFCREGYHSKHNSSYWLGEPYLGIGPSAHSYNGTSRQWNIANNALYMRSIESGTVPAEAEELSPQTRYNDYILTALRTIWGCDTTKISRDFGPAFAQHFTAECQSWLNSGHLHASDSCIALTQDGKLLADRIASDLFFVEE